MEIYINLVNDCAEQARALVQHMTNNGIYEPVYLYARESKPGAPGKLIMVRDSAPQPPDPAFAEVREKAARALSEAVRKFDAE